MTIINGANVLDLYNATGYNNAVLTDHDDFASVTERTTARREGWPILAYQIDLTEGYPEGMSEQQAQEFADQINSASLRAASVADHLSVPQARRQQQHEGHEHGHHSQR